MLFGKGLRTSVMHILLRWFSCWCGVVKHPYKIAESHKKNVKLLKKHLGGVCGHFEFDLKEVIGDTFVNTASGVGQTVRESVCVVGVLG